MELGETKLRMELGDTKLRTQGDTKDTAAGSRTAQASAVLILRCVSFVGNIESIRDGVDWVIRARRGVETKRVMVD